MIQRSDRWTLVKAIISTWWPPLTDQDHISAEEIKLVEQQLKLKLPQVLCEWYELFGRRQDFIGNQDHLLPVEELRLDGDVLVFCDENQVVVSWGIHLNDLSLIDPPVIVDNRGGGDVSDWTLFSSSLYEFLRDMVIYASVVSGQFTVSGIIKPELMVRLEQHYNYLCPSGAFLGDSDTLIWIQPEGSRDKNYLWMATRTRVALERFLSHTGHVWDNITHGTEYWMHNYGESCRDIEPPYIVRYPMQHPLLRPGIFPPCHWESRGAKMSSYPNPS